MFGYNRWMGLTTLALLISLLGGCSGETTSSPPPRPLAKPMVICSQEKQTTVDRDFNGVPDRYEKKLAAKFAPCLVFTGEKIWPVSHDYILEEGADLIRRVYRKEGGGLVFVREEVAREGKTLKTKSWADLPLAGRETTGKTTVDYRYHYYLDGPGENLGNGPEDMTWDREFERIQGGDLTRPEKCKYPPLQYAHYYWKDWKKGRLGIQYWFFYPYNKFINSHEGDWEHINVILDLKGTGDDRFDPEKNNQKLVHYEYFFHKHSIVTTRVIEVASLTKGEVGRHPVVFVGGYGRHPIPETNLRTSHWILRPLPLPLSLPFATPYWEGYYSGGSYPWPGRYEGIGGFWKFKAGEKVIPGRAIHADQFQIEVLPEPQYIDYEKRPTMSWYNLHFYSGNWEDPWNPTFIKLAGGHLGCLQISRKMTWNGRPFGPWNHWDECRLEKYQPPKHWPVISNPGPGRGPVDSGR